MIKILRKTKLNLTQFFCSESKIYSSVTLRLRSCQIPLRRFEMFSPCLKSDSIQVLKMLYLTDSVLFRYFQWNCLSRSPLLDQVPHKDFLPYQQSLFGGKCHENSLKAKILILSQRTIEYFKVMTATRYTCVVSKRDFCFYYYWPVVRKNKWKFEYLHSSKRLRGFQRNLAWLFVSQTMPY